MSKNEEPMVWVPLAQRKRQRVNRTAKRLGKARHVEEPQETPSGEATAHLSLLEQAAMQRTTEEPKNSEEHELHKALTEFKPLVAVHEAAKGISYTKRMVRSWRAPRWIQELGDEKLDLIRAHHKILMQGIDLPPPITRFCDLKVPKTIVQQFYERGIESPSPIQIQGIPTLLSGRDMIGVASTGSGKTLVFSLPLMMFALEAEMKLPFVDGEGPVGIIVAPSRELARQTFDVCQDLANWIAADGYPQLRGSLLTGGVSKGEQMRAMRGGWHFCVATPGRLNDMLNSRKFTLDNTTYLALDEADRLIDAGFEDDIRNVMSHFKRQRQTALFSATMPQKIQQFARTALVDPVEVNVGRAGATNPNIVQEVEYVREEAKCVHLLRTLAKTGPPVLCFSSKTQDVDKMHEYLLLKGVDATAVHGGRTQEERSEAVRAFKAGEKDVLVCTDVGSKGLDFAGVKHVINFDMGEIENYVHRIGRTGRGGKTGIATTFINETCDEQVLLDLKYLLLEAKQHVPAMLKAMKGMDDDDFDPDGQTSCKYCDGLGHRTSRCPKMAKESRAIQSSHKEFLRE